jgi:GTP-binding protein
MPEPSDARSDADEQRLELTFLTSAPDLKRCPPPDRPEVAVAGRSNAGKSSVLNRLTGNRQTAKVSKTPGRTQLLNFFDVQRIGRRVARGRLVDLPGYGFARAGREAQARWQAAVNRFLSERRSLRAVVLVMDIRHPLQPYDVELIDWAAASELPMLVLLNKADKLKYASAFGHLEHQLVVHLHDHQRIEAVPCQPGVDADHGALDDVGGGALHGRVDGGALGRLAALRLRALISGRYSRRPNTVST